MFDFSKITDMELINKEQEIDMKLGKVLLEMRYNAELENMYSELEAIKEEKNRRGL